MTQQSKLLKLLASPSPLPESSESDINLSRYAERLLKQYIGRALEVSLLPTSTLLAHYLHIPPTPNKTPFEVPVIVRNDAASRVLGSFMDFRDPSRHKHLSLTERVTRKNKSGVVVVMSSKEVPKQRTKLCRHVHIQIKDLDDVTVPVIPENFLRDIKAETVGSDGQWSLYSHTEVDQISSEYEKTKVKTAPYQVNYEGTDKDKKFFRSLFHFEGDNYTDEYIFRVAPVIKTAKVIFCIPKLFDDRSPLDKNLPDELGAGACVFYVNDEPDPDTLENLYVISHKLCSVASNIYDVARVISEKKTRNDYADMVGCIRHSLENSFRKGVITASTPPETLRRLLRLEVITVSAAGSLGGDYGLLDKLSWKTGGIDGETVGKTIETALSHHAFSLEIKDEAIREFDVDARLAVIVVELARNLRKHYETGGQNASIRLSLNQQNHRTVDIELSTECLHDDAATIYGRLNKPLPSPRGVDLIYKLASRMLTASGGSIKWSFRFVNTDKKRAPRMLSREKDSWCVEGPASIFNDEVIVDRDRKLVMTFKAESLGAIA